MRVDAKIVVMLEIQTNEIAYELLTEGRTTADTSSPSTSTQYLEVVPPQVERYLSDSPKPVLCRNSLWLLKNLTHWSSVLVSAASTN
jgi:hypothetical protein